MKSTVFVGLDVHLRHTNVCILDQRGNRVKRPNLGCAPFGNAGVQIKI